MADLEVTSVDAIARKKSYETITHLGGRGWRWTRQRVTDAIRKQEHTFYTMTNGRRSDVHVVMGLYGAFLRTKNAERWTDDLLHLPPSARSAASYAPTN